MVSGLALLRHASCHPCEPRAIGAGPDFGLLAGGPAVDPAMPVSPDHYQTLPTDLVRRRSPGVPARSRLLEDLTSRRARPARRTTTRWPCRPRGIRMPLPSRPCGSPSRCRGCRDLATAGGDERIDQDSGLAVGTGERCGSDIRPGSDGRAPARGALPALDSTCSRTIVAIRATSSADTSRCRTIRP